ncbi:MAG TPA: hypothetical protein VGF38_22110 [Ktedonobacterales bacterium]|jgi:hypothetical protein
MSQWPDFDKESEQLWADLTSTPERVVDADVTPSPTYALPAPANATYHSHATQLGHKIARVGVAVLLLLVGVVTWILLAVPAGILGCLLGLAVSGALIAGMLYTVRASCFWRW